MFASIASVVLLALFGHAHPAPPIDTLAAHSPSHVHRFSVSGPTGLSPAQIKSAYNLPASGGAGKTIAVIDAYDDPTIAGDASKFSSTYGLGSFPVCTNTVTASCLNKVKMSPYVFPDSGWSLEMSLDVEWAHAIAPQAQIMLVEARSPSYNDLLAAIDYARKQPGVVAVSMSWGGSEFSNESSYDSYFTSKTSLPIQFFSSAGDSGTGVSWPAVSPNVIGVGGTTLNLSSAGKVTSETAWSGSGGGVSAYVSEPAYQAGLKSKYGNHRTTPDVSYDADPATGFAVYDTTRFDRESGWFQVGGTSAGTPQWAAIDADGGTVSSTKLYSDSSSASQYAADFFDILQGSNGSCGTVCTSGPGYDTVTGLGSPRTSNF